jgi:hypothetical protein
MLSIEQRRSLLRLAAAAALETHAGLRAVQAWEEAGRLPESVREQLRDAGTIPISAEAQREVRQILTVWRRRTPRPRPYPLFAELDGFEPDGFGDPSYTAPIL